jgi:peptidoglycan/LPS O-acetylase OafA/YrhL
VNDLLKSRYRVAPTPRGVRLDLQLLRAVAVGTVVLYHLWPNRLPGGYVGVDVFFVISGFLITSHLMRNTLAERGVDVLAFWGNRARRLLPLACFVLLATVGGMRLVQPPSMWRDSLENVIASALYVQNWKLSSDAVNYLARDRVPPPTQHFWSLSVEEQFYIVWPLLIVVGTFVAVRMARRSGRDGRQVVTRTVLTMLVLLTVVSFVYSLWLTETAPDLAYFATTTRAWEFAAGALLAFAPAATAVHLGVRVAASWIGTALILVASFFLPEGTPFPGVAALLPVIGAVLFIWAGDTGARLAPTVLARVRPITWIGDISYGIYLWHWPLIVLVPYALPDDRLGNLDKLAIGSVAIALAAASKKFIEDPFRYGRVWRDHRRRSFYPAAAGMITVCAVAAFGIHQIQASVVAPASAASAPRLDLTVGTDPDKPLRPSLVTRAEDKTIMYDCFNLFPTGDDQSCTYGTKSSPVSIAIIGDSHSAHFIPGLIDAVNARGWKLTTHVGVNCDAAQGKRCAGGKDMLRAIKASNFDLVLFSAYRDSLSPRPEVLRYVKTLKDAGVPVVPVADVPMESRKAFDCVESSGGKAGVAARCATPIATALGQHPDRNGPIAKKLRLPFIDLTDEFCDDRKCYAVINNVIVHADTPVSHLTTTFSRLLAPRWEDEISRHLKDRGVRVP